MIWRTYFNSQPHEEADPAKQTAWLWADISTHSLTKRLTEIQRHISAALCISTHSLTKRLTLRIIICVNFYIYFNSQPHEEADARATWLQEQIDISTHSLTKRLTIGVAAGLDSTGYFNSQPHEEADELRHEPFFSCCIISTHSLTKRLTSKNEYTGIFKKYFNSQPHEEADALTPFLWYTLLYFNSQPHEEADGNNIFYRRSTDISTHSLTKRLTWRRWKKWVLIRLFQLTASRRGWQEWPRKKQKQWSISTHSLTKRLTHYATNIFFFWIFQLTASRRGWQHLSFQCACPIDISTHSLTKRLTFFHIVRNTMWKYFNSQPHEEADGSKYWYLRTRCYFNSQPHEEAD